MRFVALSVSRRLIAAMSSASLVQAAAAAGAALWATIALGTESRGVMVIALTTASMVSLLGGFGTGAAYRALLPLTQLEQRRRLAAAYTTSTIVGAIGCAALSFGVMAISQHLIDPALGLVHLQLAVAASALMQCLRAQSLDAWYADGCFQRGSVIAATAAASGFVGLVVAGAISTTPTAMILGSVAFEGIVMLVSVWLLRRRRLVVLQRTTVAEVVVLIRLGWPSLIVLVGVILVFRADRYVVGAVLGASAVTLYSLAATFAELARTVPHALGQVLVRRVAERSSVSIARTVGVALVTGIASAVAIGVVGWIAIPLVFDRDVRDARDYLVLLLVAEVLFAPFFIASRGLIGGGWNRTAGLIGAVGCVAAVISYLVLVPPLGIVGACLGSALTYAGLSTATMVALNHRLALRDGNEPKGRADDHVLVPDVV